MKRIIAIIIFSILLVACNNVQQTSTDINSNQLILSTHELGKGFTIDQDNSMDMDMTQPNHAIVISNSPQFIYSSNYNFISTATSDNETVVHIQVSVFSDIDIAKQAFYAVKNDHLSQSGNTNVPETVQGVQGGIKKNPAYNQQNPFASTNIEINHIGDLSFCYQWKAFAPVIVYTYKNIKVEVSVRSVNSHNNTTWNNQSTLEYSETVAILQLNKIKKALVTEDFH